MPFFSPNTQKSLQYFLPVPHPSPLPSSPPFLSASFCLSFLLPHRLVALGIVWVLRQVNRSSDNDRFGGGGGGGGLEEETGVLRHLPFHQPQDQHENRDLQEQLNQELQNHDQADSCGQCLLPSQPWPEPENEGQANSSVPEELISQFQSNLYQHNLASISLHLHQQFQYCLKSVFSGSDLVDWLTEHGLCAGRAEAKLYGVRLQRGGVLDHLTGQYSFRDVPTLLYHFTQCQETCQRTWGERKWRVKGREEEARAMSQR